MVFHKWTLVWQKWMNRISWRISLLRSTGLVKRSRKTQEHKHSSQVRSFAGLANGQIPPLEMNLRQEGISNFLVRQESKMAGFTSTSWLTNNFFCWNKDSSFSAIKKVFREGISRCTNLPCFQETQTHHWRELSQQAWMSNLLQWKISLF